MKKVFILMMFFLSSFIISDSASPRDVSYSEPLTELEIKVCNSVREKETAQDLSVLDKDYEAKRDEIYTEAAEEYGIDYATVVDILFTVGVKEQIAEME